MSNNLVKRLLSEFLSFLQYKIDNDLLTMEEMDSLSKTVETNLKLIGTADDFSKFYDQPRTNISSVIHRKLLDKCWDWAVAVTMVKSTYCHLLNDWFPDADEKEKNEKIAELAVHWLKDESTSSKIWDEAK